MRSSRPARRSVIALVLTLAATACSSAASGEITDPEVGAEDLSIEIASEEVGEPDWTGAPVNPFDLRLGQCFNEVSWIDEEQERRIDITAMVDCSEPHDREVYHEEEFPAPNGAPYPGDGPMTAWSTELCYESFADFVGAEYELSIYEIDFLQPTQATFEHPVGRHRRVTCFLFDPTGEQLVGSARASAR